MRVKWCDTPNCCNTISVERAHGKMPAFCVACSTERRHDQYRAYKARVRGETKNPGRALPGQRKPKRKLIRYAGFDPSEGRSWNKSHE